MPLWKNPVDAHELKEYEYSEKICKLRFGGLSVVVELYSSASCSHTSRRVHVS